MALTTSTFSERVRTEFDPITGNPKYFFMCADFISNSVGDTPSFNIQGRHGKSERGKAHIQSRMCGVPTSMSYLSITPII